jgi:HEPN domain-containing protein
MRKEAEEWLRIGSEDLDSAKALMERKLSRMVCYHSQQTVEKVLKAIMSEHGIDIPRIHNLIDLRSIAEKLGHETSLTEEDSLFLNSIYRFRYPATLGLLPAGEPNEVDAQKAIEIASRVFHRVKDFAWGKT